MQNSLEQKDYVPEIGDIVDVVYLTGAPIRGVVSEEYSISAQRADELRKHYPDIKEGDKIYKVTMGGDYRYFFVSNMTLVERNGLTAEMLAKENKLKKAKISEMREISEQIHSGLAKPIKVRKPFNFSRKP